MWFFVSNSNGIRDDVNGRHAPAHCLDGDSRRVRDEEQSERFVEAARKLSVDESGKRFERAINTVFSHPKK